MSTPTSSAGNLLFGILALQMDFIRKDALLAAVQVWSQDRDKPLGQVLVERGALTSDCHAVLEALVQKHLQRHGHDPKKCLAVLSPAGLAHDELRLLAGPDVPASMACQTRADRPGEESRPTRAAPDDGDPLATRDESPSRLSSRRLRFSILRPHAQGGLGKVSVARDEELQREVALKEIQDRHADRPESRARFLREATITGGLEHPGVVPVYALGHYDDGRPYYAMRFIQGESMLKAIQRFHKADTAGRDPGARALELRQLLQRFIAVCNAIAYAHSRGVLHRDLKPANVMLGKYGETLVVDWGLAKLFNSPNANPFLEEPPLQPASSSDSAETAAGTALGTPQYMSPEQAAGRLDLIGPASDVYSLGATLYCLLTGQPPFAREDTGEVLQKVQTGDFPPPQQVKRDVPPALEAICLKAMARKPPERYVSPRELADDVEHWLADEPVPAYREPWSVRSSRWFRRHRTGATAGMAALLVASVILMAATVLLTAAYGEAEKQRGLAETQEGLARQAEKKARTDEGRAREAEEKVRKQKDSVDQALRDTRQALGVNKLQLAHKALEAGDARTAQDLLAEVPKEAREWEWNYLQRQCQGSYCTLYGHIGPLTSLAFSPDGRSLASASTDRTVKIWDAASGQVRLTLAGHTGPVTSVAFSPDSRHLATASGHPDRTVRIWDAVDGQALHTLQGHTLVVNCVVFSPDGRRLASASHDRTVKVWDTATGRTLCTLAGHREDVVSVAFSPDSQRLVSASHDRTVKLWDAAGGPALFSVQGHNHFISSVAFSPDGLRLASASWDQTVKVWEAANGRELLTLKGHAAAVNSVVFSPDGRHLASAGSDQTVKVWDVASGQSLLALKGHVGRVVSVAFSPDGRRLASAGIDQSVKLWDATSGQALLNIKGHTKRVSSVDFSSDDRRLASASWDQTVKVWDAASGQLLLNLPGHTDRVTSVCFSPNGQRLASASVDQTVRVWDAANGQCLLTLRGHTGGVAQVAFSPDGRHLASASDLTVKVWDAAGGQSLLTLAGHTAQVSSVAFSRDGQRLASASWDKTVKVWDVASGDILLTLSGHTYAVNQVVFSPDRRRLASASGDRTVKVWDATDGQALLTLTGHTGSVESVVFSQDGRRLASAGSDQTVRIWDAASGQALLTLAGHTGLVAHVVFSPNHQRLASAGDDETVKVWNTAVSQARLTLAGHSDQVASVAFSPDSGRLASASHDTTIKVWDTTSGQTLLTLAGHTNGVRSVAFSPNGRFLASGSRDQTVKVWDASNGQTLLTFNGHRADVFKLAFSADSRRLVSQDATFQTLVWDLQTGRLLADRPKPLPEPSPGAVSPDGRKLALPDVNRIQIVDLRPPSAEELAFRQAMARSDFTWHLARASESEKTNQWFAAAFHLGRLLQVESDNSDFLIRRARALAALRKWSEVIAACTQAIDGKATPIDAWYWRGHARAHLGRWEEARADLTRAIHLDPKNVNAFRDRCDLYAVQMQWQEAAADLTEAVQRAPSSINLQRRQALLALARDSLPAYRHSCARMMQELMSLPVAGAQTVGFMGTPLGQGPLVAVVQLISGTPKLTANNDPDLIHQVVSTVLVSPDVGVRHSHLVRLGEMVVAQNPANASYQEMLGAALCRAERYEAALDRLSEALRLHRSGGTSSLHLFRALALHRLGRSEDARRARDQASVSTRPAKQPTKTSPLDWMEEMQANVLLHEVDALLMRPSRQD